MRRNQSSHGSYLFVCRSSSSTSGATHGSNGRPQAWARVAAASRTPPRPGALLSSRSALLSLSLSLSLSLTLTLTLTLTLSLRLTLTPTLSLSHP